MVTTQELIERCVAFNKAMDAIDAEAQSKKDTLKAETGNIFEQRDAAILADYAAKPDSIHVGDRVRMKKSAFTDYNWTPYDPREQYGSKVFTVTGFDVMAWQSLTPNYWIQLRAINDSYTPSPDDSPEMQEYYRNNLSLPQVECFEKVS